MMGVSPTEACMLGPTTRVPCSCQQPDRRGHVECVFALSRALGRVVMPTVSFWRGRTLIWREPQCPGCGNPSPAWLEGALPISLSPETFPDVCSELPCFLLHIRPLPSSLVGTRAHPKVHRVVPYTPLGSLRYLADPFCGRPYTGGTSSHSRGPGLRSFSPPKSTMSPVASFFPWVLIKGRVRS